MTARKPATIRKLTPVKRPVLLLGLLLPRILPLRPCAIAQDWLRKNALLDARTALLQEPVFIEDWLCWLANRIGVWDEVVVAALLPYDRAAKAALLERNAKAVVVGEAYRRAVEQTHEKTLRALRSKDFAKRWNANKTFRELWQSATERRDAELAALSADMMRAHGRGWRRAVAVVYPVLVEALLSRNRQ